LNTWWYSVASHNAVRAAADASAVAAAALHGVDCNDEAGRWLLLELGRDDGASDDEDEGEDAGRAVACQALAKALSPLAV
jgi:hypothetical protein